MTMQHPGGRSFLHFGRVPALLASLAMMMAGLLAVGLGAAGPASAATNSTANPVCPAPKGTASLPTDNNVEAAFTPNGHTTSYTFSSANEHSVSGVPGLTKYCVYSSAAPSAVHVQSGLKGANGQPWLASSPANPFNFGRPGGNPSNIPLDGTTNIAMGTATWTQNAPTSQTIVLHVNDASVCGAAITCFVKPGHIQQGPICDNGDKTVAYNANPTDVVNCLNPALGFEAQSVKEFGDGVGLAGTARGLTSLKVDFQSFACASGTWNNQGGNNLCGNGSASPTPPPGTSPGNFVWPITANIYAVDNSSGTAEPGTKLATVTTAQTIPLRPAADPSCPANGGPAPAGAAWFNPLAPGGGQCQNSIGTVLTFNFPSGITLPDQVIWTVAFNTSTAGYSPVGPGPTATCTTTPITTGGCPYDSLNVGDKTYTGAPYAGTDLDPNGVYVDSTSTVAENPYCDPGSGTDVLRLTTPCWAGFRPLGEITTS